MALSPADFAAYSRATGTPYPEDPEERAQLAPEVAEFRRNQLKQPESEGIDPVSVGIGLGLAAAGAGGAAYGIRSLFKGRDLPKQEGQSGAKQVDLGKIARTDVDYVYGRQTGTTPPPSKEPNLTDIQDAQVTVVADQQNESVDSGSQQFLRRRLEEGQRNVTKLDESISTPQEERLYAPGSALPPSRRSLREDKITTRLEAERELLNKEVLSPKAWNESLTSRQAPQGPVNFPSAIQGVTEGEEVSALGYSSPLRETFSTFAQIDPEMVERNLQSVLSDPEATPGQKAGALKNAQLFRTASAGVTGESGEALLDIARSGKTPYTNLIDEEIGGVRGQLKQVLNPAYAEAMQNYWERRSMELPHTMKDYQQRKEAGMLNYQLPPEQRDARNNAQAFKGWDKRTSEALQEIYASEVGDIPQYVTEYRAARGEEMRASRAEAKPGEAGGKSSFAASRSYVPVYQPEVNPGMQRVGAGKDATYVGFPSYNLASLSEEQQPQVLRYKGPEGGNVIDTVPLAVKQTTEREIAPGVMGQFTTTKTVMSPLQRVRVDQDPSTGKPVPKLVNFQIRLDQEIQPGVTLQEAALGIKQRNQLGDGTYDYSNINKEINKLLENTVGDVPIMKQSSFDAYDESRSQFINMLTGTSYETGDKGFLTGVGRTGVEGQATQFQKLPYTGPQTRAKSAAEGEELRRTNILEAQNIVRQELEGVLPSQGFKSKQLQSRINKTLSAYLPSFDESGVIQQAKPQQSSDDLRLVGQPKPDVMYSPQGDKDVRSGYYERVEARMGGAVSSQLRDLLKQGAQVSEDAGNIVYSLGENKAVYPKQRLLDTLKSENQDALSIANLTGQQLPSTGQSSLGTQQLSPSPRTPSQQRASEAGYYYDESGKRIKEPRSTSSSSFTGPARYAAGPIGDVLEGNYPQGEGRLSVRTSPTAELQEYNRYQLAAAAEATPGGRMVRGAQQMGAGLGAIPAGLGGLTESETVTRYGATGSQLQQFGNQLMAQAAYKRGQQPGPTAQNVPTPQSQIPNATPDAPVYGPSQPSVQGPRMGLGTQGLGVESNTELTGYTRRPSTIPEAVDPIQARNDAVARHIGNYISAASQRLEGGASIAGAKLKGVGQNALRPYQEPSEGMIQQLMRAARRR